MREYFHKKNTASVWNKMRGCSQSDFTLWRDGVKQNATIHTNMGKIESILCDPSSCISDKRLLTMMWEAL